MHKLILLPLFALILLAFPVYSQEIILDEKTNRFLINQKSDKPRLDVIVQSFTDYERNVISKEAVMDITTKPTFKQVSDNEYDITASRMGEKLTFVIRDFQKLEDGVELNYDYGKMRPPIDEAESSLYLYVVGNEKCRSIKTPHFGSNYVIVRLLDKKRNTVFKLNVKFSYPKPELIYIDVRSHDSAAKSDSLKEKAFIKKYNQAATTYSGEYAVPDQIIVAEIDLYFGFKKAYYDGKLNSTSVATNINGMWRNTGKGIYPFTHLYFEDESQWNWLENGMYTITYSYLRDGDSQGRYSYKISHGLLAEITHFAIELVRLMVVIVLSKPGILAIIIAVILFATWGNRMKKIRDEAKKTNLELQSIQAQLNPHFVFNALGSVQGLINKNEIEKANIYLTDFSKLLRSSLNNNGKETVPLSEELNTLNSYIRLEQMRFDFRYELNVDQGINSSQVEIPSLLIQPIVENAIKHGISSLGEQGLLIISMDKSTNDLVITVEDNGKGFDTNQQSNGQGLKLTRERIEVLNKQRKKIILDMKSNIGKGTVVNLTLKQVL